LSIVKNCALCFDDHQIRGSCTFSKGISNVQTRTNEFKVFSQESKEITFTCSIQVYSSYTPTPKTTLGLHIGSCTTMEKLLDHPWCF
jgi:hypothetical protein